VLKRYIAYDNDHTQQHDNQCLQKSKLTIETEVQQLNSN